LRAVRNLAEALGGHRACAEESREADDPFVPHGRRFHGRAIGHRDDQRENRRLREVDLP
jgi:hypothetical protein